MLLCIWHRKHQSLDSRQQPVCCHLFAVMLQNVKTLLHSRSISVQGIGVWSERTQACSALVHSEFVLQNALWYYPCTSNSLFLPIRTWQVSFLQLSEGILLCLDSVSGRGPWHPDLMWNAMQGSQSEGKVLPHPLKEAWSCKTTLYVLCKIRNLFHFRSC